ncbi:MAG: acyltransferase family protein [Selenomonadaceae bacterium]|nr:acyltransferase family protein [Selenomonadaceae bacterium]
MAKRINWIDFAKGGAIILVVLGHVNTPSRLQDFIYVFHMPFFFVTAGFLLNFDKWGGAENFRPFAAKLFKRLLVPYYVAEILWYPIWYVVCHEMQYPGYLGSLCGWNLFEPLDALCGIFVGITDLLPLEPLWFLPCLLLTEIIFVALYNRLNKFGAEIFVAAIVIAAYIGFVLSRFGYLPWGFNVALVSQIFLLAGILIRRYNVIERLSPKLCGVLTLILIVAFEFNDRVEMSAAFYGDSLLFCAGGVTGTLLIMKISALMTGGKIFSTISLCGRQSMMILVLHPIVANVFYEIIARATNFPPEIFFTEPTIIFGATVTGVLIPLTIAERFGKLPVLKYFCP